MKEAARLLQLAATAGNDEGKELLGLFCTKLNGVAKDGENVFGLFPEAAERENIDGKLQLGSVSGNHNLLRRTRTRPSDFSAKQVKQEA